MSKQADSPIYFDEEYGWRLKPTKNHKVGNDILDKVDRFEVIDSTGRAYVKGSIYGTPVEVMLSLQDDGRTLKVFVEEKV